MVNLEGVRFLPKGKPSKTLARLHAPGVDAAAAADAARAGAGAGVHVLCAGSRYARNDTPLIMEKVVLDLGAYIRHASEKWGYEKIVLCGWSGGGSLSLFYQSQAENRPSPQRRPATRSISPRADAADAMIFQAAHLSRARDALRVDRSVGARRERSRIGATSSSTSTIPRNPNQPPYSADFIARFRAAQLARMRRRTAWVKEMLAIRSKRRGDEIERGFVTHRTMADLRFLDPAIDPERPQARLVLPRRAARPRTPDRSASHASRRCARGCRNGRSTTRTPTAQRCARIDHRAAARDRELGRRRGAAAAHPHHLRRRRQQRQDLARHQGRDALLPGAARAARGRRWKFV